MDRELLLEMSRHQAWADGEHWKALHGNQALLEDAEIRARLNHMLMAVERLTRLARGGMPDLSATKEIPSADELEAAMGQASRDLAEAIGSADLDRTIQLPRGPRGPFEAPAGVLLLQALMHG